MLPLALPPSSLVRGLALGLGFFLSLAGGPRAIAGTNYPVAMQPTSGVKITLSTWMKESPTSGYMPVRATLENATQSDHVYELSSSSDAYGSAGSVNRRFSSNLLAKAGTTSVVEVMVPIACSDNGSSGYRSATLSMNGAGVERDFVTSVNSVGSSGRSSGSSQTELIGFDKALEASSAQVNAQLSSSTEFLAETLTMSEAPHDWRGYSGLAQLWITEGKLVAMAADQRAAMLDWVATGGRLFITVDGTDSSTILSPLQFPASEAAKEKWTHGAGIISTLRVRGMPPAEVAKKIAKEVRLTTAYSFESKFEAYRRSGSWHLPDSSGEITLQGWLIFGFIVVFGIIIGPVNLFILAPSAKRQRLFWTTPLISLAGSGLLVLLMLVQDGTGGTGARTTLAIIEPRTKRLAITQEQATRCGLLLSRSFSKAEPAWLVAIPRDGLKRAGFQTNQSTSQSDNDDEYTGDWFSSRSQQALVGTAVRSSREALELIPGAKPGDAPSVVSSLSVGLQTLYVFHGGQEWKAENVATGQRVVLKKTSEYFGWQRDKLRRRTSDLLARRFDDAVDQGNSWFAAEAEQPAKLAIATLPSIKWVDDRAFIVGPVTLQP